jgi:hypothetical protein
MAIGFLSSSSDGRLHSSFYTLDSFWFLLVTLFLSSRAATVATLPSALFDERFASLGASWVFSFQPVLPPVYRPRFHPLGWKLGQAFNAVTGTRRLGFCLSFLRMFCLYAAASIAL